MTGTARVIHGNALDLPLPDNSVDLVVTSPPYFGLRSYQDGGEHYTGQIGDEATPAEFVAALLDVTRECVRVLKPSGSLWVNLGDKYATRWASDRPEGRAGFGGEAGRRRKGANGTGVPEKSLIGIPWRYALACIDDLGLILRAEVIWSKPNGLPESVTDRVRRSHETWFHFTPEPRYYSAVDEIRESYSPATTDRYAYGFKPAAAVAAGQSANGPTRADGGGPGTTNPLGKLPGSVWTIPTEPLRVPAHLGVDHFAAFPTEWPLRIIRGWSPLEVCGACGEARRPVTEVTQTPRRPIGHAQLHTAMDARATKGTKSNIGHVISSRVVTGSACACPDTSAPSTPGVVLDPFGGTGTTALVAKALGRTGITVDLSTDYCRLATWRTNDPAQLARVRERIHTHGATTALTDTDDPGLLDLLGDWDNP